MIYVSDEEIESAQYSLLPKGCKFNDEAKNIIRCWESKEIAACPGSGKTTVLLAKLKVLASRMPFNDGSGICVLSHTNVAVNEIKSKLASEADKLLGYPNFVGTLQSFIDRFLVLPYLRTFTNVTIRPMDDKAYATQLMTLIYKNSSFSKAKALIKCKYNQSGGQYENELDYIMGLQMKKDGLYPKVGKKIAGKDKDSTIQYRKAINYLLKNQGLIRFSDTYRLAPVAAQKISSQYPMLYVKRFKYIFIDEYQDCDAQQRDIIEKLFPEDQCIIFRIGDVDQSIFNGKDQDSLWEIKENRLPLSYSNRYGQEIADVITPLRIKEEKIVSNKGLVGLKPVLIVFDINNPTSVLPTFLSILDNKGLTDINGVYKVIGKIKNGSGLKIGDYWTEFNASNLKSQDNFWTYLNDIHAALSRGELYFAELCVRRLLCEILRLCNIRDDLDKYYNISTVKVYIDSQKCGNEYRTKILELAQLELSSETINQHIRSLITLIIYPDQPNKDIWGILPKYFFSGFPTDSSQHSNNRNLYVDSKGRKIYFDTVHGVKGETHDATLYVETFERNGRDLKRVLPLFEGKKIPNSNVAEYARRCVYVGLSRPRILLCVAVTSDTFNGHEKAFKNWEIIDIRTTHCK